MFQNQIRLKTQLYLPCLKVKTPETTSLQFWMDTESKFEILMLQTGGMHKFFYQVLSGSSSTDILLWLFLQG